MPSEVERALLDAIRAEPDSWDARLVYADWLTEQGDPRGELIALHHRVQYGPMPTGERAPLWAQVRAREECKASWLAVWTPPAGVGLDWDYGFVVGVSLPWNTGALALLDALVAHPVARLLTSLRLHRTIDRRRISANDLLELAALDALRGFTALELMSLELDDDGLATLLLSDNLGNLAALELVNNRIGDDGVRLLATTDALPNLRRLNLSNNRIGGAGAQALATSDRLLALTELSLVGNGIGDEGTRAMRTFESLRSCRVWLDPRPPR